VAAAACVGIGATLLDHMVGQGAMPCPRKAGASIAAKKRCD